MANDWRIAQCPKHKVLYNVEAGACAFCLHDAWQSSLKPAPNESRSRKFAGMLKFICPFCGSRAISPKSCSRFACRWKAGMRADGSPRPKMNRCRNCGARTKYPTYCTYYPCRRKLGTRGVMMYARRRFVE
jgi:hypothetical protein